MIFKIGKILFCGLTIFLLIPGCQQNEKKTIGARIIAKKYCIEISFLEIQPETFNGTNILWVRVISEDPELNRYLESRRDKDVLFWENSNSKDLHSPVDYVGKMKVRKVAENKYDLSYANTGFEQHSTRLPDEVSYYTFVAPRLKIIDEGGKTWTLNQCKY